jgi:predicted nucleotidyltransferase
LVSQGIVLARPAGNAVLYALNREHLAASLVVQLVDLRVALWARLGECLAAWEVPALHVSAFGSAARGDGDERSDIDLMVVRPEGVASDESGWEAQIDDLRKLVRAWTGNLAQIVELDREELRRAAARGERLVDEVRRDGIGLMGVPFASLAPERPARRRAVKP